MSYEMSEEDKKWQRRSDARTLAEAEQIKADKERYKNAIVGAKEIAKERINEANSIIKVAGMKAPSIPKSAPQGVPTKTQPFNKRSYNNPATIGRF